MTGGAKAGSGKPGKRPAWVDEDDEGEAVREKAHHLYKPGPLWKQAGAGFGERTKIKNWILLGRGIDLDQYRRKIQGHAEEEGLSRKHLSLGLVRGNKPRQRLLATHLAALWIF